MERIIDNENENSHSSKKNPSVDLKSQSSKEENEQANMGKSKHKLVKSDEIKEEAESVSQVSKYQESVKQKSIDFSENHEEQEEMSEISVHTEHYDFVSSALKAKNFYQELRIKHSNDSSFSWKDTEFLNDNDNIFMENDKQYVLGVIRPENAGQEDHHFFKPGKNTNIEFEFKVKKGLLTDRAFVGAMLMLFRRKQTYLQSLVFDWENKEANMAAGFMGFNFFFEGQFEIVTVDTNLFVENSRPSNDLMLSTTTHHTTSYWLAFCEKAYAKKMRSFDVNF